MNKVPTCEVVHETKESSLQKSSADSSLAVSRALMRSWVQTPLRAIFDKIYFVLCNFISVRKSDRNASNLLFGRNPNEPLHRFPSLVTVLFNIAVNDFDAKESVVDRCSFPYRTRCKREPG